MTFVNPEKAEIDAEHIPKSANVFVVYCLTSAKTFRTAENLIVRLSQEGITGLPMRFGIIHNSQAMKLESWKDFRNRFCCFLIQTRICIKLFCDKEMQQSLLSAGLMINR